VHSGHNKNSGFVVLLVMFLQNRLSKLYRPMPDETDSGDRNYHALEERDNS
jgi:hypothetical protein